jgi:hypothetical protein
MYIVLVIVLLVAKVAVDLWLRDKTRDLVVRSFRRQSKQAY